MNKIKIPMMAFCLVGNFLLSGFTFPWLTSPFQEGGSQEHDSICSISVDEESCFYYTRWFQGFSVLETVFSALLEHSQFEEGGSDEYRAMWISYLELSARDLSTREKFVAEMEQMFLECKDIGLNRVIVQVRPYGDALYPSEVYPWSHLISGTQGVDPGFDPLEEMVILAHGLDLEIEAWVNPYRARIDLNRPTAFSADNPALHTDLVMNVGTGIYYNPALSEVQAMVVQGIVEIVENYDVDGIHLDDYFYPSTDLTLDYGHYLLISSNLSQEDWRRDNVNTLVKSIYDAIKAIDPEVEFGISPQGNNSNNYEKQYSDVNLWMSTPGYVDYITPQLYWGFDYSTDTHPEAYQFETITETWLAYPRHPEVSLYIGLAPYRIGDGDGSDATLNEWNSGENLRKMMASLSEMSGVSGYTLFRHDFLFHNTTYPLLAESERNNIKDWNMQN